MTAITLTINAPSTKAVSTTIDAPSARDVTPQSLEMIAKVVRALTGLQSDEIKCLADQLEANCQAPKSRKAENGLAAKLGANKISEEKQRALELAAIKNFFEWRQELLKDSLTAPQVAKLLNTSRQTPHDRRKNNTLVAVQDNGVWKYPHWQFDPNGPDGVIAGLPDVLKALDIPDFSKISWLVRPNPALDGLTPIEALKRGYKDEVITEARTVGVI